MKLYLDRPYQIAPAPVLQSVPRTDAEEISVNVSMITQTFDCVGQYKVPKKYTIIQPDKQRVIACIVFEKVR